MIRQVCAVAVSPTPLQDHTELVSSRPAGLAHFYIPPAHGEHTVSMAPRES